MLHKCLFLGAGLLERCCLFLQKRADTTNATPFASIKQGVLKLASCRSLSSSTRALSCAHILCKILGDLNFTNSSVDSDAVPRCIIIDFLSLSLSLSPYMYILIHVHTYILCQTVSSRGHQSPDTKTHFTSTFWLRKVASRPGFMSAYE